MSTSDTAHDWTSSADGRIDLSDLGIVAACGASLFAARLVFERTWLSFHRGGLGAGYAPGLDIIGWVAIALAMLWVILVAMGWALRHRPISALDAWLVGIIALSLLLCAIPGEEWRLATARVGGARHAPKSWIVWSAARGEMRLLDYLLSHGASANARIANGQTALGAAAAAGQLAACELLIARGARLNERMAITDQTALMEAAEEGRTGVVRWLLAHGADTAARDTAGLTAEDWAALDEDTPVLELLRSDR